MTRYRVQGGPPQGEAKISSTPTNLEGESGEVIEKEIQELFMEEKTGTLVDEEKAPFELAKLKKDSECQSGDTGNGAGAPADEKLPSPYLAAMRLVPPCPPRLPHLTLVLLVALRNQPASMVTQLL
jgi:hypothetical protein